MATDERDSGVLLQEAARDVLVRLVRILAACGLDRADVVKILAGDDCKVVTSAPAVRHLPMSHQEHLICTDMVFRWRRDTSFLDASGLPAVLPIFGHSPSLQGLARLCQWNRSLEDLVAYLNDVGAISRVGQSHVRLVSESVLTCTGALDAVVAPIPVLGQLQSFLECVEFNLTEKKDITRGRFERACYAPISKDLAAVFERLVEARAQELIDSVDEWLARHASKDAEAKTVLAGVGAYTILRSQDKII